MFGFQAFFLDHPLHEPGLTAEEGRAIANARVDADLVEHLRVVRPKVIFAYLLGAAHSSSVFSTDRVRSTS